MMTTETRGGMFYATAFWPGRKADARSHYISDAIAAFDTADGLAKLERAELLLRAADVADDDGDRMILAAQAGKLSAEARDLITNRRR